MENTYAQLVRELDSTPAAVLNVLSAVCDSPVLAEPEHTPDAVLARVLSAVRYVANTPRSLAPELMSEVVRGLGRTSFGLGLYALAARAYAPRLRELLPHAFSAALAAARILAPAWPLAAVCVPDEDPDEEYTSADVLVRHVGPMTLCAAWAIVYAPLGDPRAVLHYLLRLELLALAAAADVPGIGAPGDECADDARFAFEMAALTVPHAAAGLEALAGAQAAPFVARVPRAPGPDERVLARMIGAATADLVGLMAPTSRVLCHIPSIDTPDFRRALYQRALHSIPIPGECTRQYARIAEDNSWHIFPTCESIDTVSLPALGRFRMDLLRVLYTFLGGKMAREPTAPCTETAGSPLLPGVAVLECLVLLSRFDALFTFSVATNAFGKCITTLSDVVDDHHMTCAEYIATRTREHAERDPEVAQLMPGAGFGVLSRGRVLVPVTEFDGDDGETAPAHAPRHVLRTAAALVLWGLELAVGRGGLLRGLTDTRPVWADLFGAERWDALTVAYAAALGNET